jgi:hypothetical protein
MFYCKINYLTSIAIIFLPLKLACSAAHDYGKLLKEKITDSFDLCRKESDSGKNYHNLQEIVEQQLLQLPSEKKRATELNASAADAVITKLKELDSLQLINVAKASQLNSNLLLMAQTNYFIAHCFISSYSPELAAACETLPTKDKQDLMMLILDLSGALVLLAKYKKTDLITSFISFTELHSLIDIAHTMKQGEIVTLNSSYAQDKSALFLQFAQKFVVEYNAEILALAKTVAIDAGWCTIL